MKWECMGVSICMLCNIGIVLDFFGEGVMAIRVWNNWRYI